MHARLRLRELGAVALGPGRDFNWTHDEPLVLDLELHLVTAGEAQQVERRRLWSTSVAAMSSRISRARNRSPFLTAFAATKAR